MIKNIFVLIFLLSSCSNQVLDNSNQSYREKSKLPKDGIKFKCSSEILPKIEKNIIQYMRDLEIDENLYHHYIEGKELYFNLKTAENDYNTINLFFRPEYNIKEEVINLFPENKSLKRKAKNVLTVSKKEIALALMQHGRTTEFSNQSCSEEALFDHIGIRQNIVAWSEKVNFIWPDGSPATWNKKYWNKGTPITKDPVHVIVNDILYNEEKYSIGCYTATKIIVIQGVLDYFYRIKKDYNMVSKIEKRLRGTDNEPLTYIEPRKMWSWESDFDKSELNIEGKLLQIANNIPSKNIIPGDWIYLLNSDHESSQKTGYEGSNAIYLGRNKLDDYYNDHNHYYLIEEKMDEVYQWRNKVFSRSNHTDKIKPLSYQEIQKLFLSPDEGGLLFKFRAFPHFYNNL